MLNRILSSGIVISYSAHLSSHAGYDHHNLKVCSVVTYCSADMVGVVVSVSSVGGLLLLVGWLVGCCCLVVHYWFKRQQQQQSLGCWLVVGWLSVVSC